MAQRKESIEAGIEYKPRGGRGPRPNSRGLRPHVWVTGPDPRRHDQYVAWMKHKSQAAFRDEAHDLTFAQWEKIWNKDYAWENRGRAAEDVCLIRTNAQGAWTKNNVEIVTRQYQLTIQAQERMGKSYSQMHPRKTRSDKGLKRVPRK